MAGDGGCSHGISRQNDIRSPPTTALADRQISEKCIQFVCPSKSIEANLPSGGSFGGRGYVVAGKNLLDSLSKLELAFCRWRWVVLVKYEVDGECCDD